MNTIFSIRYLWIITLVLSFIVVPQVEGAFSCGDEPWLECGATECLIYLEDNMCWCAECIRPDTQFLPTDTYRCNLGVRERLYQADKPLKCSTCNPNLRYDWRADPCPSGTNCVGEGQCAVPQAICGDGVLNEGEECDPAIVEQTSLVVFEDDFSYAKGWTTPNPVAGLQNGKMVLTGDDAAVTIAPINTNTIQGDYSVEVTAIRASSTDQTDLELVFAFQSIESYYRFAVDPAEAQLFVEYKYARGEYTRIFNVVNSPYVNPTTPNVLKVEQVGNEFRFYCNDNLVWTLYNPVWADGMVGLRATNNQLGLTLGYFDDFSVNRIEEDITPSAYCCSDCTVSICGNRRLDCNEECDDGNTANGDGCTSVCTFETVCEDPCGDGNLDTGEQCDDGNRVGGDGCASNCEIEVAQVCGEPQLLEFTDTVNNKCWYYGTGDFGIPSAIPSWDFGWSTDIGNWMGPSQYSLIAHSDNQRFVNYPSSSTNREPYARFEFSIPLEAEEITSLKVIMEQSARASRPTETCSFLIANFATSQWEPIGEVVGGEATRQRTFTSTMSDYIRSSDNKLVMMSMGIHMDPIGGDSIYQDYPDSCNIDYVAVEITPNVCSVCGNNVLEAGEQCDDGNTLYGDGCSSNCKIERPIDCPEMCGDGVIQEGEECDSLNFVDNGGFEVDDTAVINVKAADAWSRGDNNYHDRNAWVVSRSTLFLMSAADDPTRSTRYEQEVMLQQGENYVFKADANLLLSRGRGVKGTVECGEPAGCGSLAQNVVVTGSTLNFDTTTTTDGFTQSLLGAWQTKQVQFTVPFTGRYKVRLSANDGSQTYFDTVSLVGPTYTPPPPPPPQCQEFGDDCLDVEGYHEHHCSGVTFFHYSPYLTTYYCGEDNLCHNKRKACNCYNPLDVCINEDD